MPLDDNNIIIVAICLYVHFLVDLAYRQNNRMTIVLYIVFDAVVGSYTRREHSYILHDMCVLHQVIKIFILRLAYRLPNWYKWPDSIQPTDAHRN